MDIYSSEISLASIAHSPSSKPSLNKHQELTHQASSTCVLWENAVCPVSSPRVLVSLHTFSFSVFSPSALHNLAHLSVIACNPLLPPLAPLQAPALSLDGSLFSVHSSLPLSYLWHSENKATSVEEQCFKGFPERAMVQSKI